MRFLICGGRDFGHNDHQWWFIFSTLSELLTYDKYDHITIINGAQRGVDKASSEWAEMHGIPYVEFPADWKRLGRAAGPIRNKQMLDEGKPDWVIAFPGGDGTNNMVQQAERRGVKIKRIQYVPNEGPYCLG